MAKALPLAQTRTPSLRRYVPALLVALALLLVLYNALVQPIGPTIPLVEIQGRWIAGAIAGTMALPGRETMQREIVRNREALARRYLDSPRYTLEVDFRDYARQLRGDMERGRAAA